MTTVDEIAPIVVHDSARESRRERLRLVLRSRTFVAGAVILAFWVFCALFGPLIVPDDPYADDILNKLQPPSAEHWFGTDRLGRDVFSRVIVGARDILIVAPLATLLGTVLGTALGLVTGYFRGLTDEAIMRVVDAFLAIPVVVIGLLALTAVGPSRLTVILVIGVVFTPIIARTVRAAVLSERELEYVEAARLRNERAPYIPVARSCRTCSARCSSNSRCGSATRSSPSRRCRSSASGSSRPRPTGGSRSSSTTAS
jgi:peptide/nickel transport system permease protein